MVGKRRRYWETFKRTKKRRQQRLKHLALPQSEKLFKSIKLKNGLSALLVSDPAIKREGSQAAVSIRFLGGSLLDPPEVRGLAHFLGSDKYPAENELDEFLSMHGGDSNAETDTDHTHFYLKVLPQHLEVALERIFRCLTAPLLLSESMSREISTIDGEFELLKQQDSERLHQLMRHTSMKEDSFLRFRFGTKTQLFNKLLNQVEQFAKV